MPAIRRRGSGAGGLRRGIARAALLVRKRLDGTTVRVWIEHVRTVAASFSPSGPNREDFFRRIVEYAPPGLSSASRPLLA